MNIQNHPEELRKAALQYLALGFSIIPVGVNKKPLFQWKAFQARRASKEEVLLWLEEYKGSIAGVAMITGEISGVVAVDIEKDGEIKDLPKTVCSKTGGGGFHFFYKYDPKQPIKNAGRIRELTDIRGDGGFIIMPPSKHASGNQYAWIDEFGTTPLAEFPYWLLKKPPHVTSLTDGGVLEGKRNDAATRYAGKLIASLPQNKWETEGWKQFLDWNKATCQPPLPEFELKGTWESIKRSELQKQKETKKEDQSPIYSKKLKSGVALETLYDPENETTSLLVSDHGRIGEVQSYNFLENTFTPISPKNELVANQNVRLPSKYTHYGSEAELLEEVRQFIHDYVELSEEFEWIATCYVLFTWVYDCFKELAYLRVLGDYGSGKSRFLNVMYVLCYKGILLNGASSTAVVFRIIDEIKGTFVLDEADFPFSDTTQDMMKILNSGFQAGYPVYRAEPKSAKSKSFDPKSFDVFCPKVIASREYFKDEALESRCFTYAMSPLTREDIKENLTDEFDERALLLRNKLLAFRLDKVRENYVIDLPKIDMEPRLRQIAGPLHCTFQDLKAKIQILEFLMGKQKAMKEHRFNSFEGEVLQAIIMALEEEKEPTMKLIAAKYNEAFASEKYFIKPKRAGQVVENIFHLKKKPSNLGIRLECCEENAQKLGNLKIKFGFAEEKVNEVKQVNIPWEDVGNTSDNPTNS